MEKLIVSMVRFSSAMALYGMEQLGSTVSLAQGGRDMMRVLDDFGRTLDALSDSLSARMKEESRKALGAMGDLAVEMADGSFAGLATMDPGGFLRTARGIVRRSAEALSALSEKRDDAEPQEPQRAAVALP